MKRIFFILLLLFGYAQAQNSPPYKPMFAGTVNEWWLNVCAPTRISNFKYFTSVKQDTVINGNNYLKFYYVYMGEGPLDTLLVGFIREDTTTKRVFLRKATAQAEEGILWDFNHIVSDTIKLIETFCEYTPVVTDTPSYGKLVITALIQQEFEGVTYQGYVGEGQNVTTYSGSYECIGNIQNGIFNEFSWCGSVEELSFLLYRKRDGIYFFKHPNFDGLMHSDCVGPARVNEKLFSKSNFGINYDPKTDLLNLVSGRFSELNIYDLQGRLLLTKTLSLDTQTVSLSELTAQGLFIVEGKTVSGATLRFRIAHF